MMADRRARLSVRGAAFAAAFAAAVVCASASAQVTDCPLPDDLLPIEVRLPTLERVLSTPGTTATIVILGPLATGGRQRDSGAVNYPARLQSLLARRFPDHPVRVELIGRPRGSVAEQRALIDREVLPLKPALVLWQIGRADARRTVPAAEVGRQIRLGIAQLRSADLMLVSMQYHPQSEALYRTDDYRNELRWAAGSADVPVFDRFEMIEHWSRIGLVDLDSTDPAVQLAAAHRTQVCIAGYLDQVLAEGVSAARDKVRRR